MSAEPPPARVLVADDQPVARAGTTQHLTANGYEVCAVVDDLRRLQLVMGVQQPDLVLIETSMGARGRAPEAIAALLRGHPNARVVAFTSDLSLVSVEAALDAGCRGVVPKTATIESLLAALDAVLQGDRHLHPRAMALLLGRARSATPVSLARALSRREREVLVQMADGKTNRAIGGLLGISETTVKTHVRSVLRKLGSTDRAEAVARALRSGLIA